MTFTIEQIRKYLESRDSFGDCLYQLSEENIIKANAPKSDIEEELDWKSDDDLEFERKLNDRSRNIPVDDDY